MSQINPSARLRTLSRWMRRTATARETITPENILSWADALEQIGKDFADVEIKSLAPDPIVAYGFDRINAVEAEIIVDSVHKLVDFLARHAQQAATVAELVEIDAASSAVLDAAAILGRGVARPNPTQTQTGA